MHTKFNLKDEFFYQDQDGRFNATGYAALWGSGQGDNVLFYNVAESLDSWEPYDWFYFAKVIGQTLRGLDYRNKDNSHDIYWLGRLQSWAVNNGLMLSQPV